MNRRCKRFQDVVPESKFYENVIYQRYEILK